MVLNRLPRPRAWRLHQGTRAEPSLAQLAMGVAAFVLIAAACLYLAAAAGA